MKYRFIDRYRFEFRVEKMCLVLGVARSAYYAWRHRAKSVRQKANERIVEKILQIHKMSRETYGSPRITAEIKTQGFQCSENRIARLMRVNAIMAKTKRRFKATTYSRHGLPVADNLLRKGVSYHRPNAVWVSDITYIPTSEGWLYLSAILDLFSRKVVGWAMSERISQDLVINALKKAVWKHSPGTGLVFHSDQGVQYASHACSDLLKRYGFLQSMSRRGNCYDNAFMESFFHTLKTEEVYFSKYRTRSDARQNIFSYIEGFYNRIRRHSALGYRSPLEFEQEAVLT